MPEIKVNVSPEYRDYVTTREIGGERYLMIKMTGALEVNGIIVNCDTDSDEN